ncbi:thaumatin family protein [Streptacidiphilus sp. N1-12]|uniref:Thaumatin family protein n=2 Tax=Streptacidiphilus alkalitolerans TaxID=3342712 RepID=A0ABV6WGL4_9ACTN
MTARRQRRQQTGQRQRHRARSGRGWLAGLLAAAVAVVIIYWATSPADPVSPQAASGPAAAASYAAAASAAAAGTASPTATASATPRPSASTPTPGASASTHPAAPHTTKAAASGSGGSTQAAVTGTQRSITVVNHTQQTIWAIVTNTTAAYPDGKKLLPGQSASLAVANNWGGRIWGRTGCASTGRGVCLTGDCTTVCSGPVTPTTLGEFSFNAFDNMDFYDVSMVDGSNLPMYINVSHTVTTDPLSASGCYKGTCTSPVNCPSAMRAMNGGQVIGCKPPCAAFGGDTYCCRGAWAGRDNCVPSKWPVDYTQVFKKAEPYAYSYAFDDGATMACKGQCYYRVTFGTTG